MDNRFLKRSYEGSDDGPPTKRLKQTSNDERGEEEGSLNLTALNDYCLESIFEHLSVSDLINVAGTNKRFTSEVILAAKRLFRVLTVEISPASISMVNKRGSMEIIDEIPFEKHSLSTVSTFLKTFGAFIPKLAITHQFDFGESHERFQREVEAFLFKYCNKTLIELTLDEMRSDYNIMKNIHQSFDAVQCLSIRGGCLVAFGPLNRWFPALRALKIYSNGIDSFESICCEFPNLHTLTLRHVDFLDWGNIEKVLHFNPTISELSIRSDHLIPGIELEDDFCEFVDQMLPHLQHLELPTDFNELNHFNSKVIKNITTLTSDRIPLYAFQQLQHLQLSIGIQYSHQTVDQMVEFVCNNPQLTYLTVTSDDVCEYPLSRAEISRIGQCLPKLTEVTFDSDFITADGTAQILAVCKAMKKFKLLVHNGMALHGPYMNINIGPNWKSPSIYINEDHFYELEFERAV